MNNINEVKGVFAVIIAILGYLFNCFSVMVGVLIFVMLIDYITGMISAYMLGEWSSKQGFKGAVKKVCYGFLVLSAFLFDYVVVFTAQKFSLDYHFALLGLATTIWLISTELVSITENLKEIGVPMPSFLDKAFSKFKETTENIINDKEADKNDPNNFHC